MDDKDPSDLVMLYDRVEDNFDAYGIPAVILRDGRTVRTRLPDPDLELQAGERRVIEAGPVVVSTTALVVVVFFMAFAFLGCHGLLSGSATMDFGGARGAATAVAFVEGMAYLGIATQAFVLGGLSTVDWIYWPLFIIPFGFAGVFLCLRIWNARPNKKP